VNKIQESQGNGALRSVSESFNKSWNNFKEKLENTLKKTNVDGATKDLWEEPKNNSTSSKAPGAGSTATS